MDSPRNDLGFAADLISQFRAVRVAKNLSQQELDGRLGIADGLTAKWENSFRKPTLFHAYCWAEALGLKITLSPNEDKNDKL